MHVDYLTRELSKLISVEVRCFGEQHQQDTHLSIRGFCSEGLSFTCPAELQSPLDAAWRGIKFNAAGINADLIHCHTWYTYLGGIMAKKLYGIPLVITVHSLEPLRPWKREQLAGGYDYSCWIEQEALTMADAIIAVSHETKQDILSHVDIPENRISVIHNGIDIKEYAHTQDQESLEQYGIDLSLPYILFVGRITRQKGMIHLLRAIEKMDPGFQIVLCASAPDTPEIDLEIKEAISKAQTRRGGIIWIHHMLQRREMVALYSGASIFICPSIYEPFGIINLEAMACGVPVIASAVGGIKEVVVDGVTGFLVPCHQAKGNSKHPYKAPDNKKALASEHRRKKSIHPEKQEFPKQSLVATLNAEKYEYDLAQRVNQLMNDPALRASMGAAGRLHAEKYFSWESIAKKTERLYTNILKDSFHVH